MLEAERSSSRVKQNELEVSAELCSSLQTANDFDSMAERSFSL